MKRDGDIFITYVDCLLVGALKLSTITTLESCSIMRTPLLSTFPSSTALSSLRTISSRSVLRASRSNEVTEDCKVNSDAKSQIIIKKTLNLNTYDTKNRLQKRENPNMDWAKSSTLTCIIKKTLTTMGKISDMWYSIVMHNHSIVYNT